MSEIERVPQVVYLGIDPGQNGGLASITVFPSGKPIAAAVTMPQTVGGVWQWFWQFVEVDCPIHACLEKVGGYVAEDQGRSGMGASMFVFGRGAGHLEAIRLPVARDQVGGASDSAGVGEGVRHPSSTVPH